MRNWLLFVLFSCSQAISAQTADTAFWHGRERTLRYRPEGKDIVINNGNRRFTRALYGTNTAFRAEAGDLPEFALYMPGMGGNMKFGLVARDKQKWLIQADNIIARYRAGSMLYEISDAILGEGRLYITVLAMGDRDGMIIKMRGENIPAAVQLVMKASHLILTLVLTRPFLRVRNLRKRQATCLRLRVPSKAARAVSEQPHSVGQRSSCKQMPSSS